MVVEGLELAGPLDPLADHVDRPDQFATLRGVVGHDQVQVEHAGSSLAEQAAADLLGAVVPEAGVEPGVPPAGGAVALDVVDQLRFGRLGRQRGEAHDEGHGPRPAASRTFRVVGGVEGHRGQLPPVVDQSEATESDTRPLSSVEL